MMMHRRLTVNLLICVGFIASVTHVAVGKIAVATVNETDQACTFYQTKNISSGHEQPDGSWLHEGVSYPLGHFLTYNYIRRNGSVIRVPPHVRGCYCLQRSCIVSCCESNQLLNWENNMGDGGCRDDDAFYKEVIWEIGFENPPKKVDVLKKFHWSYARPGSECQLFFLEPADNEMDKWRLMENGSIYMEHFDEIPTSDSYCLGIDHNADKRQAEVVVLKCIEQSHPEIRFTFLPIGMLLSVPFLMATFFVYLLIPELRNVHGKSLMCYVFGLTLAYALLAVVQLITSKDSCRQGEECINIILCSAFGYIIYFAFMVSFFWLNVMCFDIFWTFR